jgi:glycosyltransferase involved in cell wall biosynthesis
MLAARALAFPSIMVETFGLSLAEAFAAGMPAVANDLGIRRSIVGTEGAGWLAPDRDGWLQALAALESDDAVDQAGAIARERYERNFNPEVRLPRLVAIYEELRTSSRPA